MEVNNGTSRRATIVRWTVALRVSSSADMKRLRSMLNLETEHKGAAGWPAVTIQRHHTS